MDDVPEIDIEELERRAGHGAFVLDVREPDEFAAVRIPGVTHVPLMNVPAHVGDLPRAEVLVVCAKGARSHQAAAFLRSQGVDAVNVAGGTDAWVAAGKPIEAGT